MADNSMNAPPSPPSCVPKNKTYYDPFMDTDVAKPDEAVELVEEELEEGEIHVLHDSEDEEEEEFDTEDEFEETLSTTSTLIDSPKHARGQLKPILIFGVEESVKQSPDTIKRLIAEAGLELCIETHRLDFQKNLLVYPKSHSAVEFIMCNKKFFKGHHKRNFNEAPYRPLLIIYGITMETAREHKATLAELGVHSLIVLKKGRAKAWTNVILIIVRKKRRYRKTPFLIPGTTKNK